MIIKGKDDNFEKDKDRGLPFDKGERGFHKAKKIPGKIIDKDIKDDLEEDADATIPIVDIVEPVASEVVVAPVAAKPFKKKRGAPADTSEEGSEFIEKVISINRITKVTKGGKKLSFSALVVVGDAAGKIGYSLSKASEVSIAIRKALSVAKRSMITIPLRGTTITHEIIGECGGARVLLKPASEGTGVIAAGPVRAVCDSVGIQNILTKCHRSNNPINVVKATIDGLTRLKPYIKKG